MRLIALRITRIRTAITSRKKLLLRKFSITKPSNQGLDAQAIQDHGTHTAGIAAGVTGKTAVVNGVRSMTCRASLRARGWAITMFSPVASLNARSEDILNAVDAAVEDGMDVLNLSLGGGFHGNNDLLAIGLDNAVDAGVVVAVAAGNSGPGTRHASVSRAARARSSLSPRAQTSISSASL